LLDGPIRFTLFGKPRPQDELALALLRFIPENLVRRLLASGPIPKLQRAQAATKLADGLIARSLRDKQIQASVEHDKSKKDILSLISRAYTSDNEKMRLSDSEMVSTMK
jgi:cytochrome P450